MAESDTLTFGVIGAGRIGRLHARHLSYRVREFIDFLVAYFAETPYWDRDCDRQ